MCYSVTIYCPDTHLVFDAKTPDQLGVGGGLTARLRLAQALARMGNKVMLVGNVKRSHEHRGVQYRSLSDVKRLESDIVILSTTGGALDLSPALELEIVARLKEVWVQGTVPIRALDQVDFDYLVSPSNFVRDVAQVEWRVPPKRLFVIYNGFQKIGPGRSWLRMHKRNAFRLVYSSHPSKGLEAALGVLRLLRSEDRRFELHVYGGYGLWGGKEQAITPESGVIDHGLIGQERLAHELLKSSFAINLQARPEPFGIVVAEAMAYGNIVLASPVGAYREIIRHGYDSFLVPGDHLATETLAHAARLILDLTRNHSLADYIRQHAVCTPLDWDVLARAWQGHWHWALSRGERRLDDDLDRFCSKCSAQQIALADGYHCTLCGRYDQALQFHKEPGS